MALVAGDPDEPEARPGDDPAGELDRLVGRVRAAAVHPGVDLDEDAQLRAGRHGGRRERVDVRRIVDGDHQVSLARELGEGPELVRPGDRVDDEDVIESGPDEDDGLPDSRARQADRARLDLEPGELGALVDLDVRPDLGRQLTRSGAPISAMFRVAAGRSRMRAGVTTSDRGRPMADPYIRRTRS